MRKIHLKLFKNKIILYRIIPCVLLMVWLSISLSYIFRTSITVLNYDYPSVHLRTKNILQKEIVSGSFTAKDNYLGAVGVRFETHNRLNDDVLIFRIKEEGSENGFYEWHYKTDQFQPNDFFPFGFSIQQESENRKYYFEMESLYGQEENSISVSTTLPQIITQHQYPKDEVFASFGSLVLFGYKKFINMLSNIQFLIHSFLGIIPLILYLFFLMMPVWYTVRSKSSNFSIKNYFTPYPLLTLYVFFLYIVVFFIKSDLSYLLFLIVAVAAFITYVYRLGSRGWFIFAFMMLMIAPFLVYFNFIKQAETAALLSYIFLLGGGVVAFFELRS